jgi:hypothetical protein
MNKLLTRQEYLNDGSNLHRTYYAQFVNDEVKARVLRYFSKDILEESFKKDEHFNDNLTPMKKWDMMSGFVWTVIAGSQVATVRPRGREEILPIDIDLLGKAGEGYSNSTGVCVYKEAARQIIGVK